MDAFSGRPNPSWELTGPDVERVAVWLRQASACGDPPPSPPDLGYRGLLLDAQALGQGDGVARLYGGALILLDAGQQRCLADTERALERWLLDTGRAVLPPTVFSLVSTA